MTVLTVVTASLNIRYNLAASCAGMTICSAGAGALHAGSCKLERVRMIAVLPTRVQWPGAVQTYVSSVSVILEWM